MLEADPRPSELRATLQAARAQFDLVVIDTPPAAPEWLSAVIREADLVVIPVRPSPDDLRAVGATIAAVTEVRAPFAFVMSQTPRARITEAAAREIARYGRVAPVNVGQRIAYAETGATGQGACEGPDPKARQEMEALWAYVKELLDA
jgi:chromosome partitioning protein